MARLLGFSRIKGLLKWCQCIIKFIELRISGKIKFIRSLGHLIFQDLIILCLKSLKGRKFLLAFNFTSLLLGRPSRIAIIDNFYLVKDINYPSLLRFSLNESVAFNFYSRSFRQRCKDFSSCYMLD